MYAWEFLNVRISVAPSAPTTDRAPSAAAGAVAARPGFDDGDLGGADADPAQPADDGRADVRGLLEEACPAGGAHDAVGVLRYVLDGLVLQQGDVVDLADDGDVGHIVRVHVGEETLRKQFGYFSVFSLWQISFYHPSYLSTERAEALNVVLLSEREQQAHRREGGVVEMVGVDEGEELLHHLRLGVIELHHPQLILLRVVGEHGAENVRARGQHEFVTGEVLGRVEEGRGFSGRFKFLTTGILWNSVTNLIAAAKLEIRVLHVFKGGA